MDWLNNARKRISSQNVNIIIIIRSPQTTCKHCKRELSCKQFWELICNWLVNISFQFDKSSMYHPSNFQTWNMKVISGHHRHRHHHHRRRRRRHHHHYHHPQQQQHHHHHYHHRHRYRHHHHPHIRVCLFERFVYTADDDDDVKITRSSMHDVSQCDNYLEQLIAL